MRAGCHFLLGRCASTASTAAWCPRTTGGCCAAISSSRSASRSDGNAAGRERLDHLVAQRTARKYEIFVGFHPGQGDAGGVVAGGAPALDVDPLLADEVDGQVGGAP